jgi:hypothetical protein
MLIFQLRLVIIIIIRIKTIMKQNLYASILKVIGKQLVGVYSKNVAVISNDQKQQLTNASNKTSERIIKLSDLSVAQVSQLLKAFVN